MCQDGERIIAAGFDAAGRGMRSISPVSSTGTQPD
jgi:hypothetical protein